MTLIKTLERAWTLLCPGEQQRLHLTFVLFLHRFSRSTKFDFHPIRNPYKNTLIGNQLTISIISELSIRTTNHYVLLFSLVRHIKNNSSFDICVSLNFPHLYLYFYSSTSGNLTFYLQPNLPD